ncbi:MAG: histidine phosphatase family protein [Clostridia bacterium]|nr:histidine phosphatase family protein [Clostridia bacterium]
MVIKNKNIKVYLVRHCQTEGNLIGIFQGSTDTPVSEKGQTQLDLLAVRFRNIKYDRIYSSPQGRAKKTAEAINTFHSNDIIEVADFREIFMGKADGMKWSLIPQLFYDEAEKWNNAPNEFCPPEGEKMTEVYSRMSKALEKVVSEANDGETIVIVSHGCALKNLNCYLKYGDISGLGEVDIGVNTAVSLWEYNGSAYRNVYMNDCSHIPGWKPGDGAKVDFDLSLNKERYKGI